MTVTVSIQSWILFILRIKNEIVYLIPSRSRSSVICGSSSKHVTWMFPWPIVSVLSKRLICFRTSISIEPLVTWIMPQGWIANIVTTNIHVRSSIYLLSIFWITLGMTNHLLEAVLVVLIWIRRTILSNLTSIVFFAWAEIVRNQRYIMHCCG